MFCLFFLRTVTTSKLVHPARLARTVSMGVGAVPFPPYSVGASKFMVRPFSVFASNWKLPFQVS